MDGEVLERNVGLRPHSAALSNIVGWFFNEPETRHLHGLISVRVLVSPTRVRVPDLTFLAPPFEESEIVEIPPYLCIEILSPEDTMMAMQDRIDDYLQFGVGNVWVIDPWAIRGWVVTHAGWAVVRNGIIRTSDGLVTMSISAVLNDDD